MFAKFHHHQQQQYQQHHHHQLTLDHHHHQHQQHHHHQQQQHHQISEEEEESRSSSEALAGGGGGGSRSISISNKKLKTEPKSSELQQRSFNGEEGQGGGGSIEVAGKRPRGRPPGSKNKPKPPLIITRDTTTECAMRPLFLELPNGIDVIEAIARFTHKRNIGLTVLTASGSVTNVSLRQSSVNNSNTTSTPPPPPSNGSSSTVIFNGRFEILSISATFLPPSLPIRSSETVVSSTPLILPSSFMISLVGPQGQIIGGSVAGSLVTAGTVFIIAASFDNPSYHRLPIELDDVSPLQQQISSIPSSEDNHHHQDSSSNHQMVDNCGGMSMYHVSPSDLIWTPTPRLPQPQQQPF
ncbi:hypothetical protein AQUCO_01500186v1 [Aquilegia coerulea]|uniref:AT-hook motif nuclear-localized protein n=1 Tax=Aquilegia coerulea TaxID=218851 RepID=A0A2G5DSJ6_AQUCA|nr:hypothetical protein AQUCO_01500186v1 [Aquilegia coerulea]